MVKTISKWTAAFLGFCIIIGFASYGIFTAIQEGIATGIVSQLQAVESQGEINAAVKIANFVGTQGNVQIPLFDKDGKQSGTLTLIPQPQSNVKK